MKTTLNLTTAAVALVLFATTSSFQAKAADRQITVNPKEFPTFTVNKDGDKPAGVADSEAGGQTKEEKPVLKVKDAAPAVEQASSDQDEETPAIAPGKKTAKSFKVEPDSDQSATAPDAEGDDEEVATSPAPRPGNVLNEEAKLVKKPAPVETEDEATTDESEKDAAIAADKPEAVEDDVATTEEETEAAPVKKKAPRIYYYSSKQKSYEKHLSSDEGYDAELEPAYSGDHQSYVPTYYDYSGANCHQNYKGY